MSVTPWPRAIIIAAWCAGLWGCVGWPRRVASVPVATMGRSDEAGWSATTWEAASTPLHRRALKQGRAATIVGEVVDVSCFLQLGKRGDAHVACGQKCARNGQPIGVLTDAGALYLIIPEEHHPRRDGQVSLTERFAELMGKRVQVGGMVTTTRDTRALFVRTLPTPQGPVTASQ